jgi:hypothetical protein
MLVTMLVMGVVASSVMMVALRTFTDTATITNRRDVLADGRIALDRMTKQLRQGEVVSSSTTSKIVFTSYVAGASKTIVWQAAGSAAPYELQVSLNGGTTYGTVTSGLTSKNLFTYASHTDADGFAVTDEVTVTLVFTTSTNNVLTLTEPVHLRNALT